MFSSVSSNVRLRFVGDDDDLLSSVRSTLDDADCSATVQRVESIDDAFESLADHAVDCLVVDDGATDRDGENLLETVRERYPELPLVVVGDAEVLESGPDAATDAVVRRPDVDVGPELARRVAALVSRSRADGHPGRRSDRQRSDPAGEADRTERLEQADTIFRNAREGVFLVDVVDGGRFEISRVNPAYEALSGLSRERIHGKTPQEIVGAELGSSIESKFQECVDRRAPLEYEEEFDVPDMPTDWFTRIAPVVVDGEVEQIVGLTRDVTDRKEREEELQMKQRIIDEAPIGISIVEVESAGYPIVYVNRGFQEMTGYDESEILGEGWETMAGPKTDPVEAEKLQRAIEAGESASGEILAYGKDGSPFWCRATLAPVQSEDDETTYFVAFSQDVTDRKEYEKQIERDLDEFSDIFATELRAPLESAQDAVARLRAEVESDEIAEVDGELRRLDRLLDDLATVHSFSDTPESVTDTAFRGGSD